MREDHGQGGVLLASEERTAAAVSPLVTNFGGGQSLEVVIDVTVDGAAASITPTIQGYDPASGKFFTVLTGAAIAAVGTTILRVSPHLTASANLIAKDIVPRIFRLSMAVADTDAITYSAGYSLT